MKNTQVSQGQGQLSFFYSLSNNDASQSRYSLFTMMGHELLTNSRGNIVMGLPLARADGDSSILS